MTSIRDWTLEQLKAGTAASVEHTITEAKVDVFATLSGGVSRCTMTPRMAARSASGAASPTASFPSRGFRFALIGMEPPGRRTLLSACEGIARDQWL